MRYFLMAIVLTLAMAQTCEAQVCRRGTCTLRAVVVAPVKAVVAVPVEVVQKAPLRNLVRNGIERRRNRRAARRCR